MGLKNLQKEYKKGKSKATIGQNRKKRKKEPEQTKYAEM